MLRNFRPVFAGFAVAVGLATVLSHSSAAEEETPSRPVLALVDADNPKSALLIYDAASCDADNRWECPLVSVDCADQELIVTVEDISDDELGRWLLQKNGMSLVVSGK